MVVNLECSMYPYTRTESELIPGIIGSSLRVDFVCSNNTNCCRQRL